MKRPIILAVMASFVIGTTPGNPAFAVTPNDVMVCHKYGTAAENTLILPYEGAINHIRAHGDFPGACPESDQFIDLDGIASAGPGGAEYIQVKVGDTLTAWPTGSWNEGIDWFDKDDNCVWSDGDDIHLESPVSGACPTGVRNALHDLGLDCIVLDLNGDFADGQLVDFDLESGIAFASSGCPPPVDPKLKFFDANNNLHYDNGEDIVLDANNDGVFN